MKVMKTFWGETLELEWPLKRKNQRNTVWNGTRCLRLWPHIWAKSKNRGEHSSRALPQVGILFVLIRRKVEHESRNHLEPENPCSSASFSARMWFQSLGLLPLRFNIHRHCSYTRSTGNASCSPSLPSASEMVPNICTPRKREKQQRQQAGNAARVCGDLFEGCAQSFDMCLCLCVWKWVYVFLHFIMSLDTVAGGIHGSCSICSHRYM